MRLATLALLLAPALAACQTGRGTVTVIDRSLLEVLVDPPAFTGEVGDTVTFVAIARDTVSGDTIPAQIRWSSLDSTGVSIDPVTGTATLLRAGTYEVEAEVIEIVSIVFLSQDDDGGWSEFYSPQRHALYTARGHVPSSLQMTVGETRPVCTYLETEEGFELIPAELSSENEEVITVSGNGAGDNCPTWNGATAGMAPMELYELTQNRGLRVG